MSTPARIELPQADDVLSSRDTVARDDVDDAQATISDLFCTHVLRPLGRDPVHLRLRSAHLATTGIEFLDYGGPVQISPVGLNDFHLVQIPLTGRATMSAGRVEVESSRHVATVPPIDRDFVLRWDAGTPHLIVYVGRDELVRVAAAMYGLAEPPQLTVAPQLNLDTIDSLRFLRAVVELHDTLQQPVGTDDYAGKLAAELMIIRLLQSIEHSLGGRPKAWATASTVVHGDSIYRRYLALLDDAAYTEAGVMDATAAIGVPLRTLQEHVRAAAGTTPSALLRDARYRRAHELLAASDQTHESVTSIAQRCGFGHLGRFSVDYRARYGESPAQTLRR
ncbi:AraC family transcriptional regulator [Micromonospora sp. DT81.3]|uniref:AraC family transcriptional regulator n=1 Tax=Actinomycetes TaxID=1760 RepID=UPI003CF88AEB